MPDDLVVNGWTIRAHPLLLDEIAKRVQAVRTQRMTDPGGYRHRPDYKLLLAIRKLMFQVIPADPLDARYRQGDTLGPGRRHWFRAKFGNGRFRLFFRFDSKARIIVYAWVNDEATLRTYGRRTDAYAVFGRLLDAGNPPDTWEDLLKATSSSEAGLAAQGISADERS